MNAQEREKLVYERCQLEKMIKDYDFKMNKAGKRLHKELQKGKNARNNKLIESLAAELKITIGTIDAIQARIEHINEKLA